ncbi:ATP-dependent DNA ligase [uncultured Amnibacterium sp.]|uniref:DUF7882 family protein n=1 Tax=uncultured Amnibacterium sp. TaxID=1631851 RepID=UPI0035CB8EA1
MGTFIYDGAMIEFDDRLLTHLQIVIMQKFRRQESFAMSWLDALAIGDGRSSIWLTPTTPLYFKFAGSRTPAIDATWLGVLGESANSSRGLVVVDEHGRPARAEGAHRKP